jgi:hypothetical protein
MRTTMGLPDPARDIFGTPLWAANNRRVMLPQISSQPTDILSQVLCGQSVALL